MHSPITHPRPAPRRRWPRRTGPQWLAIAAGALATFGALAILLAEPWTTGQWRLEHVMLPILVALVIAAGHLVGDALRDRRWLHAAGFALVFVFGTALTVYSSVGAQKQAGGDRAGAVAVHNTAVRDKAADLAKERADLAIARDMLRNVQRQHAEESRRGGCRAACQGLERSITVYTASITGHETRIARLEADLRTLGGERVARPKAQALADVLAVFGFDRRRVETASTVLEAPAYSLTLELMAIAAFGFGFARSRLSPSDAHTASGAAIKQPDHPATCKGALQVPDDGPDRPASRQESLDSSGPAQRPEGPAPRDVTRTVRPDHPKTRRRPGRDPDRPGGQGNHPESPDPPRGPVMTRDEALAYLQTRIALGRSVPSQAQLAAEVGRPEQTVSDWLKRWERDGAIPTRRAEGRVKVVG